MQTHEGAFVVSLDFELHWGVRRLRPAHGPYRSNLLAEREAIPKILELFQAYGVAATWATVGFLFARSRDELEAYLPPIRPNYVDRRLDPYDEPIGKDEEDDPLHFAPSLIELIRRFPRQEIGSHTFSHYYCNEPGQTREAFKADVASAMGIAGARGITLQSIVLPRNQFNSNYADVLVRAGIRYYRGSQQGWMHANGGLHGEPQTRRIARMIDSYLPLSWSNTIAPSDIPEHNGLLNIRASQFLRPYMPMGRSMEFARLQRISAAIEHAAKMGRVFHLWWHPHNFGSHMAENLAFLRSVLERFAFFRDRYAIRSYAMHEIESWLTVSTRATDQGGDGS